MRVDAVRVPVHVLGRDLRLGPILLVPVHRLDRDARGRVGGKVRKKRFVEGREEVKDEVKDEVKEEWKEIVKERREEGASRYAAGRCDAGPGPCFGPGPPLWADIAGPGPPSGPGRAAGRYGVGSWSMRCRSI